MALLESSLNGLPKRQGKVRDVYDLGDDRLLIVATDRISAFDWILPTGIPDKGRVLTALSTFWFGRLKFNHHVISSNLDDLGLPLDNATRSDLEGRSMIVKKAEVFPFECVVRGYLAGSGWKEYQSKGTVCDETLPLGLVESSRLDPPIFTPATKSVSGHDENVPFSRMREDLQDFQGLAEEIRKISIDAYTEARTYAEGRGLILADTKFELGWIPDADGRRSLGFVDEALTPDSSRYWPLEAYTPGHPQSSFDKQYVRDWLEATSWDKSSPPPPLPPDIVARTRDKYIDAYEILTGKTFPWK